MASVEVESATNTLPEKVEVPKEVEAVVATPPAPEPEVEESTKATIEPLNADAPPPVEDPPTVQDPVEIESKGVDEPKTDEEQVKADTTQEEVKETEAVPEETLATTDAVIEETAEAVIEETTTTVTEEAEKPVEEDQTPTEVVVNTEVAKEE
ncbi:hypothetical protein HanXRQr2_Chr01g0007631 [Helianthus annuus]|uniref:Uncharacterized protein n=1 Tax=Helianthus annuus TaxID=4232 RepID=A0A251VNS8_HELAN|nr:titin [Helianthus annuus]KAF5820914.1 hypothetical protein HanXRQr2_Chr01g0007631 [Helianthus annuus]KAJ0782261.1 hypothetical protein HanLR1_Chr01g0006061 [Helianthus annuus]